MRDPGKKPAPLGNNKNKNLKLCVFTIYGEVKANKVSLSYPEILGAMPIVVIPEFHHVLDTLINVLSIFLNGLLLYLIKNHSTFRVKTYRRILATSASIDLVLSICALLAQPVSVQIFSRPVEGAPL